MTTWRMWFVAPFAILWRSAARAAASFRVWLAVILSAIVLLVVYYALADRYTPLTADAYVQAYVVQVAPQVEGQVVGVYVGEGQHVAAGALLYELDRRPFEHRAAMLEARLVEAEQEIKRLEAELAAGEAELERTQAEAEYASAVYEQEKLIYEKASTTERKYLDAVQKHRASQAAVQRSAQAIEQVRHVLDARIGGEHAQVAQVRAELAEARLDLEFCQVTAPCDAVISDLQLRVGAYAHVGQPMLTCIDTSAWMVVANVTENSLVRLADGQPALVALQSLPGRLLPARVFAVGWGVGEGQGTPSGMLPAVRNPPSWIPPSQRFQVRLVLDDASDVALRVGLTGSVSIYTQRDGWLNEVTRGVHQLIAWFYYL